MALSPSAIRTDLKCGKGAISKGEKCHKGPATAVTKAALAVLGVGGAVGVGLLAKRAWDARAAARLRDAQRNGTRFTPADAPAHATFLSSGNNGRVYVSRDRKTIYKVVTNQRAMKSFAAELTAQERARHLGVRTPKVVAADPVKGLLEMEFLDGFVPIGQATKGDLPAAQKSALRDSLISNMSKLHRAGWGHGDFHYQNVLFKGNETALIDWGHSSQNMVRVREDIWRTLQLSKELSPPAERALVSRAGDKFMNLSDPKQKDVDSFYDELQSLLSPRRDASPERGKPCGASHIPRSHKCSKSTGFLTPQTIKTGGKVALGAGVLALGAALLSKRTRKGPVPTREEWRNSPENPRNNPKLSPEDAQRIADEAMAGGQKWDVFEATQARRQAELNAICGSGLGKVLAPAKFDAAIRTPRCQAGDGAFGTYFVHTSGKYGIKVFRDPDFDPSIEFDVLGKAHATGANVPEPLALSGSRDPDGEMRTQTLIMSHMQGYKPIGSVYPGPNLGTIADAPLIVQIKALREFRKLHIEGVSHGDIHAGNVLVHPRSKKVAIVDFGFAAQLDDPSHPMHDRDGVKNLMNDLYNLPRFVGLDQNDFASRYQGVTVNIREKAENYYNRGGWEPYELAINRYHDALEADVLFEARRPRSRFVSGADQPRIPGLSRRILTAQLQTGQRVALERDLKFLSANDIRRQAADLGLKPVQVWKALDPERKARLAKQRQQPFGTPIVPNSQLIASARLSDFGLRSATSWEE